MSTPAQKPPNQHEQAKEMKQRTRDALHAVIAEQVLHALGQPVLPYQMQVRSLWDRFYRVNVLVGPDAASLRVANSYFLKTDSDGNIVESAPKIIRQTE